MTEASIGLVLDCADPEALADFWAQALGLQRLGAAGNYLALASASGALRLLLQRVGEPKVGKNRMHIDIETGDLESELARLQAIGAHRLEPEIRAEHGFRWVVMADPEGNEFCVATGGQGKG